MKHDLCRTTLVFIVRTSGREEELCQMENGGGLIMRSDDGFSFRRSTNVNLNISSSSRINVRREIMAAILGNNAIFASWLHASSPHGRYGKTRWLRVQLRRSWTIIFTCASVRRDVKYFQCHKLMRGRGHGESTPSADGSKTPTTRTVSNKTSLRFRNQHKYKI